MRDFRISVQWHITTNCTNKCKHCYMVNGANYLEEKKNTLTPQQRIQVLDDFDRFEKKHNVTIKYFYITGGDPLLAEDWYEFLSELRRRDKTIIMMGNPETLNEKTIKKLADLKVSSFQMSLDGLEKTHDSFRSLGSFKKTIDKIDLLEKYGISSYIMFTLYPENSSELIPLLRYVAENTNATGFRFDIGCYTDDNKFQIKPFSPKQVYEIFSSFALEENRLEQEGYKLKVLNKSSLGNLIQYEQNNLSTQPIESDLMLTGCAVGRHVAIISDGTVYPCRRLPIKIGKLPEQSFEEIYFCSDLMKKFRRPEYYTYCNGCRFFSVCQGCPAYNYSIHKDVFGEHPICFKHLLTNKPEENNFTMKSIPLDISLDKERELAASVANFTSKGKEFLDLKKFQDVFLKISFDPKNREAFINNHKEYLKKIAIKLTKEQIAWLMYRFYICKQIARRHVVGRDFSIRYTSSDFGKKTIFYIPNFKLPSITCDNEQITITHHRKKISLSIDAKEIINKIFQTKEFKGEDLLKWDDGYDWQQISQLISTLLTEHILFIKPKE